jgi:hypothetical protein
MTSKNIMEAIKWKLDVILKEIESVPSGSITAGEWFSIGLTLDSINTAMDNAQGMLKHVKPHRGVDWSNNPTLIGIENSGVDESDYVVIGNTRVRKDIGERK